MPSIFAIIKKSGIDVSKCQRFTLEADDFVPFGQQDTSSSESVFEIPIPDTSIRSLPPTSPDRPPTILRYFIDGSRRVQKVAEIVVGGRFFPMLAGQIGVAGTERREPGNKLVPIRPYCTIKNLISLPDKLGEELDDIRRRISAEFPVPFEVVSYGNDPERNPNDLAVQAIMKHMLETEISTVTAIASSGLLGPDALLVRDGPLQFRRPINKSAFQHVVGVSKSFSTNTPIKRGGKPQDVGSLVKDLDLFDRTKCYKLEMSDKTVAFWYMRIHPKSSVPNPLDGVIKVEKIAQDDEETDGGVDRDLVDVISRHLFEERNVTPYGTDRRWANHIYPIYATERFLKASLDSELKFSGYFRETP